MNWLKRSRMISKVFCSFFVEEYILLFVKIIVFVRPMFRIFLWCLASNSNSSVEDKTYIMGREWLDGRSKSKTQSWFGVGFLPVVCSIMFTIAWFMWELCLQNHRCCLLSTTSASAQNSHLSLSHFPSLKSLSWLMQRFSDHFKIRDLFDGGSPRMFLKSLLLCQSTSCICSSCGVGIRVGSPCTSSVVCVTPFSKIMFCQSLVGRFKMSPW